MSGPTVPKKSTNKSVCIEVNEVDQALAGPAHDHNANDPNGVVEKELIILQDGTALDLTAAVEKAVNKVLARLPLSSFVGVGAQASTPNNGSRNEAVKRPHEISEESETESDNDLESDSEMGDVLGAGVNNQDLAGAGLGGDELSAQLFGDIDQTVDPPVCPIPQKAVEDRVPEDGSALPTTVDPDLPQLEQVSHNFFPNELVVNWVRGCVDNKKH